MVKTKDKTKKSVEKIVKEVQSMLEQCRVQNEQTVEVKTRLQSSLEKARSELNKRTEAMMTRIQCR